VRTYCTRNGNCVGSDIGWSVSIDLPIQELTVGYRQAERRRRHTFCCLWLMHGDSQYFYKMAQVKTMHDKPACVQT